MDSKRYWKGLDELMATPEFETQKDQEFPSSVREGMADEEKSGTTRRDFLKLMGFSVAAVSLAACETPVKKVIPYVNKPEDIQPGIPNYYASTVVRGGDYCSVLVKTREGRPIKIEGNPNSSVSMGGTSARVQASVLDLYDGSRLQRFKKKDGVAFMDIELAEADQQIRKALQKIKSEGGRVALVTGPVLSPNFRRLIAQFQANFPVDHVVYEAMPQSGLIEAYGGILPDHDFEKAKVVVSFDADFLGTWVNPVQFSAQYAKNRKIKEGKNAVKTMSRHYQVEANLSLTGANADYRYPVKPTVLPYYVMSLYNAVAAKTGASKVSLGGNKLGAKGQARIEKMAAELVASKGKSLVVCGWNDMYVQAFVKETNRLLGNLGKTVKPQVAVGTRQAVDKKMTAFFEKAVAGKYQGIVLGADVNPVYTHPMGDKLAAAMGKASLSVSFSDRIDESADACTYICPGLHGLESWGDAEPKTGHYSLIQPTIQPIFKGNRAVEETLLAWTGSNKSAYDFLRDTWRTRIFPASGQVSFEAFWAKSLHDGVFEPKFVLGAAPKAKDPEPISDSTNVVVPAPVMAVADTMGVADEVEMLAALPTAVPEAEKTEGDFSISLTKSAAQISTNYVPSEANELVLYEKVAIGDGAYANNPWLQELPDPISKATWDNYLTVSLSDAKSMDLKDGQIVELLVKGKTKMKVPVLVQPGQAPGSMGLAVGYGREKAGNLKLGATSYKLWEMNVQGRVAIGVNAYPLTSMIGGQRSTVTLGFDVTATPDFTKFARTQTQQTVMGRANIQEAKLSEYKKDAGAGRYHPKIATSKGKVKPGEVDLWAPQTKDTHVHYNHHWGLVIDLNSCTGCGTCTISCQAENNIPVVGKDEVLRSRDMQWMRIDRYYSSGIEEEAGEAGLLNKKTGKPLTAEKYAEKQGIGQFSYLSEMEQPAENPKVTFQPMMCQHCNHAPCETVCPVLATTHSTEGLNQMTYNRCIGTRYCANNCPYKVRRFNWFSYPGNQNEDREFGTVNYAMSHPLTRMVLNPDVTVRARGVMEKCSMCVQRIQYGKLQAKIDGRRPKDGEIKTACQSACPTSAILFGDMNDKESAISKALAEEQEKRAYHVLEEINVAPNVNYLTKIRNLDA